MLAVGFSGGTVISKASGETGYLAASGMGPITARSGSLEPTFNPLHVLVVSGSVAGTGGGDPTSVRSGTIALFASGMGQLTAKSGALDPNTSPLHVLVVSGSIAGTASVSVDSGLHVMISGQSVVAKVSGETVISKVSGETVVAKVSGETVVAKVSGETIVVSISGQQVEAHVQSGAIELYASGMGRITAKSGSLEPTFTPLHVLVVSGSVAGTGGGDPTTVRSGTIALFASGMGLLTSKSGSLDPNANPLHVFVVSGSVLGTATAGDPTTVRSGTTALFASGMGLLTAKSGSLDPNANPLHVLVVSGSVVGGGGGATTTTLSGSEMSIAQFLPFLTSGEENQGLAVSGDISFIRKDVKGMAVVRIDRTHISGMYARYEPVTITAAGDTVLETPGSGRSLRLKLIQDSYLGNSGSIVVGYKFGSGTPLMFRHQVTANVPNWGMNLVGANVQGSVNVPLIANANLATSSGLGVTYVVEEVGSGAVF